MFLLSYDHGGHILWDELFEKHLDSACEWLKKYPKFKIGLDNECFAYDFYNESNPDLIIKIKKMLVEFKGRFGIGSCTYGQPLSVFINDESNVRQLIYAYRTNYKFFGMNPPWYAVSEHAFHTQIPQLVKQTGYRGILMRTHFMMYGFNPVYDIPCGIWTEKTVMEFL